MTLLEPLVFLKSQEIGDLIIYGTNITDVKWTAPKNDTCNGTILELSDSGILSLICEDGTVTWSK